MSIKNLLTPIMLFWALSTAVAAENVTVIKQPVKLNGVLSEECWTIQKPLAVFTNTKGKNLELATEVKIARSNNAVYFAAKCAIPADEKFRAAAKVWVKMIAWSLPCFPAAKKITITLFM